MAQFEPYQQKHTDIRDLYKKPEEYTNKTTTVCGWIQYYRSSGGKGKNIGFVRMKDGSYMGTLQVLFSQRDLPEDEKDKFDELFTKAKAGVSLSVTGLIVKSPKSEQPIEMQAHSFKIWGDVKDADTYPITKNELSLEFLRTVPQLRGRRDEMLAVETIKSVLKHAIDDYFEMIRFHEVQTPLITDNECEGGANPFLITTILPSDGKLETVPLKDDKKTVDFSKDFFKKSCYLTVSGQLHLEALVLGGLSQAYCWTTAFRAEPSTGPRHGAEFWMMELEFCFCELKDNMKVNEGCIKYGIQKILEKCYHELEFLQSKFKPGLIAMLKTYSSTPFPIMTHEECVKQMLADIETGKVKIDPEKIPDTDLCVFKEKPAFDDDLSKDHERYITEVIHGGLPVFVTHYPAKIKSFYMPIINKGAEIERVDNFDLLAPLIGEIAGGSQREYDYDRLKQRMSDMKVNIESLQWYLDLRKWGTVPHGGSGIGIDRLLMVCTGIFNIRDMIPFPRTYGTCYF